MAARTVGGVLATVAVLGSSFVVARALRVRLSVGPWGRHWTRRGQQGDTLLVALGDSLTVGTGSSHPDTSWLGRYVAHVESHTGRSLKVDNRAVYGARIGDLVATQLPLPPDAAMVTLCIGSNDAGRTDPEQFRRDLEQVCAQLPPGSLVGDVPEFQWGGRVDAAAELARVVREVVAGFPDLVLATVEAHTVDTSVLTELAGDFFHPGDPGHRRIAAAFVEAYEALPASGAVDDAAHETGPRARPTTGPAQTVLSRAL